MTYGTAVTDTFTRTVSSGWGSADTGQAWSTFGLGGVISASDYNVGSGVATMSVPVANAYRFTYLAAFSQSDVDIAVTGSVPAVPTGAPLEVVNLATRGQNDLVTYYLFRVQVETTGAVTVLIFAPGGVQLGSLSMPGLTYTGGTQLRLRAQSIGQIHRLKCWLAAGAEPPNWHITVQDNTFSAAGWVGVRAGVAFGNTNTKPIVVSFDNFSSVLLASFPVDQLPMRVLAAFGANLTADPSTWTWTDITTDVLIAQGVTVNSMGRQDETSQAQSAGCALHLKNISGNYGTGNPSGIYYPNVRRNTPIWVIIDPSTRFFGYVNGWTPYWDTTGNFAAVSVSANGILRRLSQGKSPVASPIRQTTMGASGLYRYWPFEDPLESGSVASAITGQAPMSVIGRIQFANVKLEGTVIFSGVSYYIHEGTLPLPNLNAGGSATASFPAGSASSWTVQFEAACNALTVGADVTLAEWTTPGSARVTWRAKLAGSAFTGWLFLTTVDSSGTETTVATDSIDLGGTEANYTIQATQSGPNIAVAIYTANRPGATATIAGVTLAGINQITVNPNKSSFGPVFMFGHLRIWNGTTVPAIQTTNTLDCTPWTSYYGENALTRLARVCAEQGVPITIVGTSSVTMGPQPTDTFINILRECETTDGGVLSDGLGPGLTYVARSARYNLPAAMTLDASAGQVDDPFSPTDDDQRNRNLWKVDRKNGGSATFQDKTGPLGTDAIGIYDSTQTPNFVSDAPLPNRAAWLVHLGTVDGLRYPTLNLDLAASPQLINAWEAAGANSHIDVANVRSVVVQHPPGTVPLLVEGYSEQFTFARWKVAANCSPFAPWRAFQVGSSRVETDGSTLHQGYSAGATSILVDSAAKVWTTTAVYPADFPLDLNIGGWQVTVTAIVGATSPQTATVNALPAAIAGGAKVSLWRPDAIAE